MILLAFFKRIFVSAPYIEFSNLDESKTIDYHTKIKASFILSVIVNDINAGKSDTVYKLDDEAFEVFREAYNRTQQKCTMYMNALEFEMIGDISKIDDQIL